MKRILIMSHAGVLNVNRAIFQNLASISKTKIMMIVPQAWRGDLITDLHFKRTDDDAGIDLRALPVQFSGNGSLFFYKSTLRSIVKEFKPDLLFLDEEPWSIVAQQAYRAVGNIEKCFYTKQNLKKTIPLPFRMAERWIFSQSSRAFVVADEVGEVLRWKGFERPIHYLPHSYDPHLFKVSVQSQELRHKLHIPKDSVVIGYFGRLTEEKGIADLLTAIHTIFAKPPNRPVFFLCVGNGPLFEAVKTSMGTMPVNCSHLLPAIPHHEVGQILSAIDVLVLPSRTTPRWKEQFGRILVEAMACGSAVLGSDSGEIPHLIKRAGGGISFQEGNASALAEALTRLINDPDALNKYKNSGRVYVEQNLTHQSVARQLATMLAI